MKVKIELFGATRDFSDQNILELSLNNDSTIKDARIEIIKYLKKNFDGNKDFVRIVNTSAFSSENNNIVSDNYKIKNNEKIAIIPPIGGG
ncbi:MAG: molybdopterin biosynthesis protein MoeD [Flavobacteriaceae bacterium TMED204]|jgi:molybdopterin synthase sulfur carrier subunit|nr:MAG: molybdopterin biosynthesis protein MoeD [Flavobacteriaceae bacterium TMED145]OUW73245.1 MAG: molybdopterin biosynthesis protein MoeD [Flavobacteriaceae bacterium TMED204]|tara:strand:- start:4122 stop:4391 length:270 start_codon:yes stop_codon:yes gene_type:complete